MKRALLLPLLCAASVAHAEGDPWDDEGFGFGALPALAYSTDDGLGYGALASIYRYDGQSAPYKWSATLLLYTTTKRSHTHHLDLDIIDLAGQPLRLTGRLEFAATKTASYCGLDPAEFCDVADAEAAAAAAGLSDTSTDEYDTFVRRYHMIRRIRPNSTWNFRYRISDMPHKVEILVGWFGEYLIPGDFQDEGAYPGSLYALDFPADEEGPAGEEGFFSNLQGGIVFDSRDNEPAPTAGYWAEASVRGASRFWGSEWSYVGYNVTLRGYTSPIERVVLTGRLIADGLIGDAPVTGLARAGGTQIYDLFGGQSAGRGIRAAGVLGKARFVAQPEVRATFARFTVLKKADVDLVAVGFSDWGYIAPELSALSDGALVGGYGGGLRFVMNTNFIVRADVAFSPQEPGDGIDGVYININNLW